MLVTSKPLTMNLPPRIPLQFNDSSYSFNRGREVDININYNSVSAITRSNTNVHLFLLIMDRWPRASLSKQ
jgi:hypothetical protein